MHHYLPAVSGFRWLVCHIGVPVLPFHFAEQSVLLSAIDSRSRQTISRARNVRLPLGKVFSRPMLTHLRSFEVPKSFCFIETNNEELVLEFFSRCRFSQHHGL